tara:strand:+ start:7737 stop:8774 length:1038 start_codon:yes stop_codon:yes gene_type:complete
MVGSVFEYLNETKKQIDAHIFNFLPTVHKNPEIDFFYRLMRDYPMRSGKRLRPALCFLTCEMFGGKTQDAIHTATALELLQSWLLIHDDIEDESILRRGEPCLHHQHGVPVAINVGDALHCKMWEMLSKNISLLGYELSFEILSEFIQLSNRVVEGQHIELSWMREKRWDVSEEDYWMMCVQKTAWYTCITPCRLGALISSNVQPDQLDQFVHIGADLGVAFQIQDDVLNLIGEEGTYGKEIAGDISEGKRTLMLIHLFRSCTESESVILKNIMSKSRKEKTEIEVYDVLNLMKKYNSIQYAEQKSKRFAKKASDGFDQVSSALPGESAKQVFKNLIDFVIERQY